MLRRPGHGAAIAAAVLTACGVGQEPEGAQLPPCPAGEVQDLATGGCVPERCGAGAWGLIDRPSDTVHVAPWGDDGWDGTEERPLSTVQAGIERAGSADGGLVAVAAGTYVQNIELRTGHDGVEIVGRCPELVVLDGSPRPQPAVLHRGGDLALRGVTVTRGWRGVEVSCPPADRSRLELEELVLEGNQRVGLLVAGACTDVDLRETTVRATVPGDADWAVGIQVQSSGSLSARGLTVEANLGMGLAVVHGGSRAELQDARVADTEPASAALGWGIQVAAGGELVARDLLVEGSRNSGVLASGAGTRAELTDTTVRDTQPHPDFPGGSGIQISDGASLAADGLLVEANDTVGLLVANPGSSATVVDATVRSTPPTSEHLGGRGVSMIDGARLEARDLLVEDSHEIGIFGVGEATWLGLDAVTIRDTRPSPDGTAGKGIELGSGARLEARGLLVEGSHEVGLFIREAGSTAILDSATIRDTEGQGIQVVAAATLDARDLLVEDSDDVGLLLDDPGSSARLEGATIRGTRLGQDGSAAIGLAVLGGAELVGRDVLLEANMGLGFWAMSADTRLELDRLSVLDTEPLLDGTWGRGGSVQDGASFVARELVLERNHEVGLFATGTGTSLRLEKARIAGTRAPSDYDGGIGAVVQSGAELTAWDLRVEDSEGPGLYLLPQGSLELWDASLDRNAFAGAVVFGGRLEIHGGSVAGSAPHATEGGGVGIFSWDVAGSSQLEIDGVAFAELAGPALYLRGPGRFVVSDCDFSGGTTPPPLPGAVLALEGVEPWREIGDSGLFTGLVLRGNRLRQLPGDAILLDASSATLEAERGPGANSFAELGGVPLVWQRCGDLPAPEVLDGSTASPSCEPEPRTLGYPLEYVPWTMESDPLR